MVVTVLSGLETPHAVQEKQTISNDTNLQTPINSKILLHWSFASPFHLFFKKYFERSRTNISVSELTSNVDKSTSHVGELVVGELTR